MPGANNCAVGKVFEPIAEVIRPVMEPVKIRGLQEKVAAYSRGGGILNFFKEQFLCGEARSHLTSTGEIAATQIAEDGFRAGIAGIYHYVDRISIMCFRRVIK